MSADVITVEDAYGPCPDWCVDADGHRVTESPDDRVHFGAERKHYLAFTGRVARDSSDWVPSYLAMHLDARPPGNEPMINLYRDEQTAFLLTLEEALDIAAHLEGLVEVARKAKR